MTITFQPNELEKKAEEYFKFYDFKWEKEFNAKLKLLKEQLFQREKYLFGINYKNFTQEQLDILYNEYSKRYVKWKLEEAKKEIKNILAKYDCDLNETCEGYITLYDIYTKEEIEFN